MGRIGAPRNRKEEDAFIFQCLGHYIVDRYIHGYMFGPLRERSCAVERATNWLDPLSILPG